MGAGNVTSPLLEKHGLAPAAEPTGPALDPEVARYHAWCAELLDGAGDPQQRAAAVTELEGEQARIEKLIADAQGDALLQASQLREKREGAEYQQALFRLRQEAQEGAAALERWAATPLTPAERRVLRDHIDELSQAALRRVPRYLNAGTAGSRATGILAVKRLRDAVHAVPDDDADRLEGLTRRWIEGPRSLLAVRDLLRSTARRLGGG